MPTSPASKPYRVLIADLKGTDICAEIPYLFSKAGCTVDIYCSASSWLLKSSYRSTWYAANTDDPEAYARGLATLADRASYDWVIPSDDFSLRALHDHLPPTSQSLALLPLSDLSNISLLGSKSALSRFCDAHALKTPPFVIYKEPSDIARAAREIGFPLVIKVDRSGGGSGVFLCADEPSLRTSLDALTLEQKNDLVMQKYIGGTIVAVEALYRKGTLLAYAYSHVVKNVDGEFSVSIIRKYSCAPHMEPQLRAIGTAGAFDGFCSYTFMLDPTSSTHYLIEADMRTHAWFALSRYAGVDFAQAIQAYLAGDDVLVSQSCKDAGEEVIVRHFFRDISAIKQMRNMHEIVHWCLNDDGRWQFVPTHDYRLLRAYAAMFFKSLVYKADFLRPFTRALKRAYLYCRPPRVELGTKN